MGDDLAAGVTRFGADVEDPVGLGGDGHVVLDDDDGVAFIDEAVEDVDEALDVFEVEADGGFFDEVEVTLAEGGVVEGGLGAAAFGEFGDEFDTLGLAAGEGGAGLAELEVAEAGVCHELEGVGNAGLGLEEGGGFVDGHGEDLADVFLAEGDFEGGRVVALPITGLAMDPGAGEEIHFEFYAAVAFAFGAAAVVGVEGEA